MTIHYIKYADKFSEIFFTICILFFTSCKRDIVPNYTSAYTSNKEEMIESVRFSDSLIAQIEINKNFSNDCCLFSIPETRKIKIVAYGEGADYKVNPSLIESYDNDGVEIYFDMKNEKLQYFNVNGDDRQYRILWNLLQVDGQNIVVNDLEIKESDPSDTTYIMEIKFPWKTLGYISPKLNVKIGFDLAILDNDLATREALVAWYSTSEWSWRNSSYFGTMVLGNYETKTNNENAVAIYTKNSPLIDGKFDKIWENVPSYIIKNVITGKLENKEDLKGFFKACWDTDNLYLIVSVEDNVKRYASVMFDHGWIEDLKGKIIWEMDMSKTKHAGGGLKNRYSDTTLEIKKGQYYLRYQSDESNSPSNWDVEPPKTNFYGIKLLKR
jgi:hypothetical protein